MGNEDKTGKMIERVDLVAEIEEYEEIINNFKAYKYKLITDIYSSNYSKEEVEFVVQNIDNLTSEDLRQFLANSKQKPSL